MAPPTAARFLLAWPYVKAATFHSLIAAVAHALADRLNILLRENRGAPTAHRMRWPDQVRGVWLPPSGPELNPMERVWRDLQDDIAWPQFPPVDAQQLYGAHLLQAYDAPTLRALAGYTYSRVADVEL